MVRDRDDASGKKPCISCADRRTHAQLLTFAIALVRVSKTIPPRHPPLLEKEKRGEAEAEGGG